MVIHCRHDSIGFRRIERRSVPVVGDAGRHGPPAEGIATVTETRPVPALRGVGTTLEDFEQDLVSNLYYARGTTVESASLADAYHTVAVTVRDRLVDRYARTAAAHYRANPRFVYYLSAEYLLGRQL